MVVNIRRTNVFELNMDAIIRVKDVIAAQSEELFSRPSCLRAEVKSISVFLFYIL